MIITGDFFVSKLVSFKTTSKNKLMKIFEIAFDEENYKALLVVVGEPNDFNWNFLTGGKYYLASGKVIGTEPLKIFTYLENIHPTFERMSYEDKEIKVEETGEETIIEFKDGAPASDAAEILNSDMPI